MGTSRAIIALMAASTLGLTSRVLQADGPCGTLVFTTASDFGDEFWVNLNTLDDAGLTVNQVRVNKKPQPLPYLWVAVSANYPPGDPERTASLVRIDTESGAILGEYLTAPQVTEGADFGRSPSRTAIDLAGNAWTANRNEGVLPPPPPCPPPGDPCPGIPGSVIKVGLVVGGTRWEKNPDGSFTLNPLGEYVREPFDYCTCVDRVDPDGNPPDGFIRTSLGLANMLTWPNDTDGTGGGIIDGVAQGGPALVEDAYDECILVYQRTNATGIRHVSLDDDDNLWAGGWDEVAKPSPPMPFDLLAGDTGAILTSIPALPGGYGGFVDGNGILWSAYNLYDDIQEPEGHVLRYNTNNNTHTTRPSRWSYGLGLDINGNIWNSQWLHGTIIKLDPAGTLFPGFPKDTFGEINDRGVVVTPLDSHVWVANSGEGDDFFRTGSKVSRLDNNGDFVEVIELFDFDGLPGTDCEEPTGVSVDSGGRVWVTCRATHTACRITPSANWTVTPSEPDLRVSLGADAYPYNNSDMTGLVSLLAHKNGLWSLRHDSGTPGTFWPRVTWNSEDCVPDPGQEVPTGTSIRVQLRAAESEAALTRGAWVETQNGIAIAPRPVGRFLELRAILNGKGYETNFSTPVLCDLSVEVECLHRLFVNQNVAGGLNDGTSWANAFVDLQDAFNLAAETGSGEIWVAEGTYKPAALGGDPAASFVLKSSVAVYGGFSGTETQRSQRNPAAHPTILSGDLNGNDMPGFVNYGDNSHHVVTATDCDATAVLDGFIMRGGNSPDDGGGLRNGPQSSPKLNDCTFVANRTTLGIGGGMFNEGGCDPALTRCTFVGNVAAAKGGGMFNAPAGNPMLVNCVFSGNSAGDHGGGLYNEDGNVTLINTSFSGNIAQNQGGGVFNAFHYDGGLTLSNCVLWGNSDSGLQDESAQLEKEQEWFISVNYTSIQGWSGGLGGTGNNGSNPEFQDAVGDNLRLNGGSPAIDSGSNAAVPVGVTTDRDGNPRILNGTVNRGAYEGFDCNANGREDATDIFGGTSQDCNNNLIPDECDTPMLVSAMSLRMNPSGPGGYCTSDAVPLDLACKSEPHQGGITEMRFTFHPDGPRGCFVSTEEATPCSDQTFGSYTGSAVRTCLPGPGANDLTCTFSPALENARTYRFNVTGGSVKIRGLVADATDDGLVNAADRSAVVGIWTGPGFSCSTDLNSDGITNAADRSAVVGAWTNPTANCAPCPQEQGRAANGTGGPRVPGRRPSGHDVAQDTDSPAGEAGDAARGESGDSDSWTRILGTAALEVRPAGAREAVNALIAGERYEVHYLEASHPIAAYTLLVLAPCDVPPVTGIAPVEREDWADAALFEYVDLESNADAPPIEGVAPEGFGLCGMVLDDQSGGRVADAAESAICSFTAGAAGEFVIDLRLIWVAEAEQTFYESTATDSFTISE